MAISESEKRKMLMAHSIGPKMVAYLERIGIERLEDVRDADPKDLAFRIDMELGAKRMNALGVAALANLVALAKAYKPL
ncbi:MAG: hypothetical protein R3D34_14465 [Nitratireductor sp.]